MQLRRFTTTGIELFRSELSRLRVEPNGDLPEYLLNDGRYSEPIPAEIDVGKRTFATRREAAEYLRALLQPLDNSQVTSDVGLWTWLTLFYFDEVCPVRAGSRSIKNDYSYIYEPDNLRHWYRHLLHIAWRVITLAPIHNRLYLDLPLAKLDKATVEVFKRLYVTRIPCVYEALERIYWDDNLRRIRKGIANPTGQIAGDLTHRLPNRLRQLEKTFDLQTVSADQLIELLGAEFDFGPKRASKRSPQKM